VLLASRGELFGWCDCSSADSRTLARDLETSFLVGGDCATVASSDAAAAAAVGFGVLVLGDRVGLLESAESVPDENGENASEMCESTVPGVEP
jgi:hypothetical protein